MFTKFTQLSYFNCSHLRQLYLFTESFPHARFVRQAVGIFDIQLRESPVKMTFNWGLMRYVKWVSAISGYK